MLVGENIDLGPLVTGRLVDEELRDSSVVAVCRWEIGRREGVEVIFAE